MPDQKTNRGYLATSLSCRCPRCREGKLFKHPVSFSFRKNMEMNKNCPVCGQATEIEVGFYFGTSYVSYALTVAISVATLITWYIIMGLSTSDNRFFYWLGFNAAFLIFLFNKRLNILSTIFFGQFIDTDFDQR